MCRNVEDHIRKTCSDLVYDVVMVGSGRLHPCLVVESVAKGLADADRQRISREIVTRTADFRTRLFPHERIEDAKRVLVVEQGTLPRTKVSRCLVCVLQELFLTLLCRM